MRFFGFFLAMISYCKKRQSAFPPLDGLSPCPYCGASWRFLQLMSLCRTENSGVSCVLGTMLVGVYPEICSNFVFLMQIFETSKFLGVVCRTWSF